MVRCLHSLSIDAGAVARQRCQGYSLHDVLVTLAVVGATSTAVVSLHGVVQNHQRTAGVNDLLATLSLARSAAITRGTDVVLCPSRDGVNCDSARDGQTIWHEGMMMFVNEKDSDRRDQTEPLIRMFRPDASSLVIKSSSGRRKVVYQPNGLSSGSTITFTVCAGRGAKAARYVVLSNSGRARVSPLPGDDKADKIHEMCP
jgi:type IV fimbrial biogenesis protein FimT